MVLTTLKSVIENSDHFLCNQKRQPIFSYHYFNHRKQNIYNQYNQITINSIKFYSASKLIKKTMHPRIIFPKPKYNKEPNSYVLFLLLEIAIWNTASNPIITVYHKMKPHVLLLLDNHLTSKPISQTKNAIIASPLTITKIMFPLVEEYQFSRHFIV